MRHTAKNGGFRHFQSCCYQINGNRKLLFEQVFSDALPTELLNSLGLRGRRRVFTPLVTLWAFINQVLDQDHSCRSAVVSVIALQSALKTKVVSSATGAYCRARAKLPLKFIIEWTKRSARRLVDRTSQEWLWLGRHVVLVDGTVLSVPDSLSNQQSFAKPSNSFGLLKARVVGIFSLSCGCLIDASIASWSGKGTGEKALLHRMLGSLTKGSVVLMDRLFGDYETLFSLLKRDVDFLIRRHAAHRSTFRSGVRLGKDDYLHTIVLSKGLTFNIRIMRVQFKAKGFRTKSIELVTSLLDAKIYRLEDIAQLYRSRWQVEIDFRSLKRTLNMDVLRCQTPRMVEKEIWVHFLVYNMIRTIIAEAATRKAIEPREVSFTEAVQLIKQFRSLFAIEPRDQERLYEVLLDSLKDRIGNRPDRIEPRLLKHCGRKYDTLKHPRRLARKIFCLKGRPAQKRREQRRTC